MLETLVGTEFFEAFAKFYISKFEKSTITSGEFRDTFVTYVAENGSTEQVMKVAQLDWDQLFHAPGMPAHIPDFSTTLDQAAQQLAQRWMQCTETSSFAASDIQVNHLHLLDEIDIIHIRRVGALVK